MKRAIIGAMLVLGATLGAAHAETWVLKDSLRPNGHARGAASKQADERQCGATPRRTINPSMASLFQQCMAARGWTVDQVIAEAPARHARAHGDDTAPSIDNSGNDDRFQRQHDWDQQQFNDTQQMVNNQQVQDNTVVDTQTNQMFQDMNNRD